MNGESAGERERMITHHDSPRSSHLRPGFQSNYTFELGEEIIVSEEVRELVTQQK